MSAQPHPGLAAEELQAQLRDLLCLAVVGDHVRWVMTGDETAELAGWLAAATPRWRGLADQVAQHLVALRIVPDGRVRSLAQDIPLNWVPSGWLQAGEARSLIANRLRIVAEWAQYRRSLATDQNTIELLDRVCSALERSP